MNKNDLVDAVAEKSGLTKKDAKNAIDATLDVITEALKSKDNVAFIGFGTFSTAERAARTAKAPGSDKVVNVPASTVVKFKVGKALKEAVASK